MNEKPGETPNPLNPNPVAEPTQTTPVATPTTNQPATGQPAAETITTINEPSTPMARPMEQVAPAPVEAPKEKKKTGLIIGIVAAVAVLLIGGIVAAIMLMSNQSDPVALAMDKIVNRIFS